MRSRRTSFAWVLGLPLLLLVLLGAWTLWSWV